MATPNITLVKALRAAAFKLQNSPNYQWGHMGSCNCGYVVQEITQLSKEEIHKFAMERHGDWSEQSREYCPSSNYPIDKVIEIMLENGFSIDDFAHLERLSDKQILNRIPEGKYLSNNNKSHVAFYMNLWADDLEEKLTHHSKIDEQVLQLEVFV